MEDWIKEYWLKALFGALISGFGIWGKKKVKNLESKLKEQESIKQGLQALLRSEIIREYEKWTEKNYCPLYARDNIQNMYKQYHGLGQNGVIDDLVERITELPTEREVKQWKQKEN
jgi:hypothetical protein